VSDSGEGMDAPTMKRVFEPFFTTKEAGKGTGLGLATVYGIARQHGGWVAVDSVPMVGSVFSFYLPVAEQPLAEPPPGDRDLAGRGQETVLLVEDEPAVRRLAARSLRSLGYQVLEAASGADALSVWERHGGSVDALVTDMVMPAGMTGLDVAERLTELKPGLKVIITTGYSPDSLTRRANANGEFRFLGKPYGPDALGKAVRAILDGRAH
jgi:two-component system, cell cycle sensor histidine kinase and response regulator CckA